MQEGLGFLVNLSVSLVLALILGLLTQRLRLSPIVGYLLAGIALGPRTPGFAADPKMAHDFAEVGVILLMFGVGLHFKFNDLLAVRRIAIPGSLGQILVASTLGTIAALSFGLGMEAALVIGIAISVASTVVFVRARYFQERIWLEKVGSTDICIEEAETAIGLAILLLREVGADGNRIQKEIQKIRAEFGIHRQNGQIIQS